MKFGIPILASTMLVAGCAIAPFDAVALQTANAERNADYSQCKLGRYPTSVAAVECWLNADSKFARAIRLKDMNLYVTYAKNMRLVAMSLDQKTAAPAEGQERWAQLMAGFNQTLTNAYQRYQQDNATMEELGAAFLTGAAAGYQQQPRPVLCSSVVAGRTISTICN